LHSKALGGGLPRTASWST